MTTPLPTGFRIAVDPDTKQLTDTTLFGGAPARVMRLSPVGMAAWQRLQDHLVDSAATGTLARRLTDAGVAHPRPPEPGRKPDITVIVPVRDRAELLARCLSSVGDEHPVLVVDDGSADPDAIAAVALRFGAKVVHRIENGGPAAARNTGLSTVDTKLVAFLDSDCEAAPGWLDGPAAHFADPLVAAVAPRVLAVAPHTWAGRYAACAASLDLGPREARVVPGTRVAYVPTAALLVRRAALPDQVFDPGLRYGEDVDLIWRLHAAGHRIRYDPSAVVRHHEPESWSALLGRRFAYGTSAGPLALRHPAAIAPLVLQPWPVVTVAALLGRRPLLAASSFVASVLAMRRTLSRADLPATGVLRAMGNGVYQTWLGASRYGVQFGAPLLLAGLLRPGGRTPGRRWGRRIALASLVFSRPLATWFTQRPPLDPVRFTAASLADDVAYGAGVWAGSARARTFRAVLPAVSWRPFRITRTAR
ncbi:MAG TPA: mycofactocin biosynthesis glycosyltransferase MftF [Pseudonocardiaceae bacterium]|nr:mycofactocin biosynthesis glycosyltransferase MftF [Pseudonocardiaceae bacterium]